MRLAARLALACAGAGLIGVAVFAEPARMSWPMANARAPDVAGNPSTPAKVELGRRLFYDADLSIDGTMSCGTCHEQKKAFTEGNRTHPGVNNQPGRRNVMALANIGFYSSLTWGDHSVTNLEDQVKTPITGDHPVEMGMVGKSELLTQRLADQPCYRDLFAAAFPGAPMTERTGAISMQTISAAIAAFEREMISFNSPYDQMKRGEPVDISEAARRGEAAFAKGGCASCHAGALFTDADVQDPRAAFHNIGAGDGKDLGLMEITHLEADREKFRTPSLRNITLSGPYLHDGSAAMLADAIRAHQRPGPLRDAKLSAPLSDTDLADVVAFLGALTDDAFVHDPRLALPRSRACTMADLVLHNNP